MVARFSTLGIGVTLARILGPHEFGSFAVAMVALLALLSFNELGVSLAIVRWEGEPSEIAPTVMTISVVSSVIIYVGCFLGAPSFATAMGAPAAANVIRVLAINVIFDGLCSTPVALMQRYFNQKRKMIADQANNWVGTGMSIALALMHFGAMSLAIGRISGATAAAIIFIRYSPEPIRFGFDPALARKLIRFGMPLAGASIVVFAVQNADQFIVGRVLGATALGFYALAFNLSSWPLNIFSMPIRTVGPALFSRLQHDRPVMRKAFLSSLELVETCTLPICLLICGAAVPLIHFVYGPKWILASEALVWLGALAAIRILFEYIYDFFVVLARSSVVFTVQLVWLVVLIPALIAGTRVYGIGGAAMAEVVVALLVVLPWYLKELNRVEIPYGQVISRLWRPVLVALLAGVAARFIARAIPHAFAACAVAGLLTLALIALAMYRLMPVIKGMRGTLQGDAAAEAASEQAARPPVRSVPPWEIEHGVAAPLLEADEIPRSGPVAPLAGPYPPAGPHPPAGPGPRPRPAEPVAPVSPSSRPLSSPLPGQLAQPGQARFSVHHQPSGPAASPATLHDQPVQATGPLPTRLAPGAGRSWLRDGGRRIAAAFSETAPFPAVRDLTGPLPLYREPLAMPIYQQTVAAMSWDPEKTRTNDR
jgi:PST family polysaccharide transporter